MSRSRSAPQVRIARALVREHDEAMPAIAETIGTAEKAARARLLHYEHRTWH
ncbi:hypothetical protein [Streptomyces sp. NPDC088752]|uniref:hypothetical protein n=1 Tax=Streptomyces sp. NPDC088752 TaxID=3154963 RepID=UPI003412B73D